MKNEITIWLKYARENLESAKLLLDSRLYNSCLQNTQQAVEKYLKAFLISNSIKLIKTHSIRKLKTALEQQGINVDISDDECDLLDTIYLPSKYPLGSVIPDFEPDFAICDQCLAIAERIRDYAEEYFYKFNADK